MSSVSRSTAISCCLASCCSLPVENKLCYMIHMHTRVRRLVCTHIDTRTQTYAGICIYVRTHTCVCTPT